MVSEKTMMDFTRRAAVLMVVVGGVLPKDTVAQSHPGWCQGVGNKHGSVAVCNPTPNPNLGHSPPQATPTYAVPTPVPQTVAQPMLVPQQVPTPTPPATPQQVPQPVAQPMLVPQQVPTPTPQATPQQVPQPVAQPMLVPQQVPQPIEQREPQIVVQRPVPLTTTPELVVTGRPGGNSIVHVTGTGNATWTLGPVAAMPGRQRHHALPSYMAADGTIVQCLAGGFGWRYVEDEAGELKLVGRTPTLRATDLIVRDVPANQMTRPDCVVQVRRRFDQELPWTP
jgi:hypothetical protein